MATDLQIVMTTTDNLTEAQSLARALVQQKLAACVQIQGNMHSIYIWNGELCESQEYLLLIKTVKGRTSAVMTFLESQHSYDIPEITVFSGDQVSQGYATWLQASINR